MVFKNIDGIYFKIFQNSCFKENFDEKKVQSSRKLSFFLVLLDLQQK